MTPFDLLKTLHICCAVISIAGFALRGYWMLSGNTLLQHRLSRFLPHIIDSLLLASAVGMLLVWGVSPLQLPWLSAKIIALLVYIGLGAVALRFGSTRRVRIAAYGLALISAGYILSVAYSKSPLGLLLILPLN